MLEAGLTFRLPLLLALIHHEGGSHGVDQEDDDA